MSGLLLRSVEEMGVVSSATQLRPGCKDWPMASRDVERNYSVAQFAAKLRRLADALEADRPFRIQVAGERIRVPRGAAISVEHEREDEEEEVEFQLKWQPAEVEDEDEGGDGEIEV